MRNLKILLMIGILLCFGFALSSEVHAQSGGPKVFEEGDILPATSQLKIHLYVGEEDFKVYTDGAYQTDGVYIEFEFIYEDSAVFIKIGGNLIVEEYDVGSEFNNFYIVDTSNLTLEQRTIVYADEFDDDNYITWEDLNAPTVPSGPKPFEIGDELPAGYIKISWDFTGYPMAVDGDFLISSDGDFSIRIWEFGNITLFINDEMFYADTPGNTIITLTESVTITDMDGYDDYYEYIHGALLWEVVSEDYINGFMEAREIYGFNMGGYWISGEQAWNNGYDLGSELAWEEGFEYGMEIYGYYDPITDQWLSVEEYINLYGTDKPGQSDFYANFDKYFIPAMIIVFGGAIVLTILKVFKGRE